MSETNLIRDHHKFYRTLTLSNGETIDNSVDGTIALTSTTTTIGSGNLILSNNEIESTSGDLTLDVNGDISLNADGGEINLQDGGATFATWTTAGSITGLKIFENGGASGDDYLSIAVAVSGATTISTVDAAGTDATFVLDIDGALALDSTNATNTAADGTIFRTAGTTFGAITSHHALSTLTLYEAAGASTDDYFNIAVAAAGATAISTTDAAGTSASLSLIPDGKLLLQPTTGLTAINPEAKLYFDTGVDTYIHERSADSLAFVVGDVEIFKLTELGGGANDKVIIPTLTPLYFDGGGDTSIAEGAADSLAITVGGDILMQLTENGADGNYVHFRETTAVGFSRLEATYDASNTVVDFRQSNKFRLEMTGDITNVKLYFPPVSCNCVLVCTTNGDHDVTNWKVYESDESAANVDSAMWPGGSVPAFTNNGIDIVSFYWDNDEQTAYGVASLAFAAP